MNHKCAASVLVDALTFLLVRPAAAESGWNVRFDSKLRDLEVEVELAGLFEEPR